jgi:SAM-dependent methyltransferase
VRRSTPDHWERYWRDQAAADAAGLEAYPNHERLVAACVEIGGLAGARVLEVGAGSGQAAVELAQAGADVTVVDYVESSLDVVRRYAADAGVRLGLVRGDAFALPFGDARFDFVVHQGLLEHFRNPVELLAENCRVLRPGGCAVVDVPQRWHPYTPVKRTLIAMDRWFAGWETSYTIGELSAQLDQAGLVEAARFGDWMVPSFAYRSVRKVAAGAHLRLPAEPTRIDAVQPARAALRQRLRASRLSFYTYANIGIVGRKPV